MVDSAPYAGKVHSRDGLARDRAGAGILFIASLIVCSDQQHEDDDSEDTRYAVQG